MSEEKFDPSRFTAKIIQPQEVKDMSTILHGKALEDIGGNNPILCLTIPVDGYKTHRKFEHTALEGGSLVQSKRLGEVLRVTEEGKDFYMAFYHSSDGVIGALRSSGIIAGKEQEKHLREEHLQAIKLPEQFICKIVTKEKMQRDFDDCGISFPKTAGRFSGVILRVSVPQGRDEEFDEFNRSEAQLTGYRSKPISGLKLGEFEIESAGLHVHYAYYRANAAVIEGLIKGKVKLIDTPEQQRLLQDYQDSHKYPARKRYPREH